ncbi:MAG: transcriptional repressor, partial [Candidatus Omnitrophica bacterium]|nr:transcriptional repressor [Candidatus Omnitrophota bacterium]
LKVTPKRVAILKLFNRDNKCLSPEFIWEKLKKQFDQIGLPSVYRNLEAFVEEGMLTKIQRDDNKRYYALCHVEHGHHHHHIVCVQCGRVDDVDICDFPNVNTIKGYKVLNHTMQIEGVCAQCQK